MANWGGGLSGAASGAKLGSAFGPWGTGIGAAIGGIAGLFGGGKNPQEQMALEQMRAQMERSNQFWKQAQGQMGAAQRYFAPIAGGSRTAAFQSMAPEITSATQRMDAGRTSLLNLAGRSGGASARLDPYAKGSLATSLLMRARPQAANAMMQMAGTTGGWAQNQGGATGDMLRYGMDQSALDRQKGAAFFDTMTELMPTLSDMWKNRGKGGNSSFIDPRTYGSKPVPGVLY